VLDVRSFRATDFDTGQSLKEEKFRKRLAVNKQDHKDFIWIGSISRS
jgi:hypothetical protein